MKTAALPQDILPAFEEFLNTYVTQHKRNLFRKVLAHRTRHVTVVLEDLFQPHNASAVLRSCDCFGVQDVHIIENTQEFEITTGITMGSHKWLDIFKYNQAGLANTEVCYAQLRKEGYRIIATSPHREGYMIDTLPLDQKTALVFGTEKNGLSDFALDNADACVQIPMYGFTESFNISVSAALCLFEVTRRLHNSDFAWQLSEKEQYLLYIEWMRRSLKYRDALEEHFFESQNLKQSSHD